MRLTLVISTLGRGGAERVMSILASAWAERGHSVTLLSFDDGQAPAYDLHPSVQLVGLRLQAVSQHSLQALVRNLRRIGVLRRAIRASEPDIVISFMDKTNVLTILATAGMKKPLIISERVDPALYDIGRSWGQLRRFVYRFADVLVCPSKRTVQKFRAISRVPGIAIPNPIDVPARAALRSETSTRQEGHLVVGMGRLVPQKGFDLLLSAFAKIAQRHPDWSLTIYGEGPLRENLESQAASLGITSRVHLAGAISDPFDRFMSADLFVFSSRFEGFGMALAEAMACGLPVVSFDCPEGPGEIIRHGIDGVLVPPQNVETLAAELDRLMGDAQERHRLALRAPEVRERFSLEKAMEAWQKLLDELCGEASQAKGITQPWTH